jgi:hypothetical protein
VLNIADTDHRKDTAADFHTEVVRVAAVDTEAATDTGVVADTGAVASTEVADLDRAIPAAEHKRGVGGDLGVEAAEVVESLGMADCHSVRSLPLRRCAWRRNPVVHRSHRFLVSPSFAP